jgi:hypothetical protein
MLNTLGKLELSSVLILEQDNASGMLHRKTCVAVATNGGSSFITGNIARACPLYMEPFP